MSDPTPQWWVTSILTAFVGLLASIGEIYRRRIDRINDTYVSKEALRQFMEVMRDDRQRMHQENLDSQHQIRSSIERVHERIDIFYQK
jgi:hypothetical protein